MDPVDDYLKYTKRLTQLNWFWCPLRGSRTSVGTDVGVGSVEMSSRQSERGILFTRPRRVDPSTTDNFSTDVILRYGPFLNVLYLRFVFYPLLSLVAVVVDTETPCRREALFICIDSLLLLLCFSYTSVFLSCLRLEWSNVPCPNKSPRLWLWTCARLKDDPLDWTLRIVPLPFVILTLVH